MSSIVHGMDEIENTADVIDSRDVIARIETLESLPELEERELDEDEHAELVALRTLAEQASDYAEDWAYGEALIRDSYFEDYARQFAEDIGAIESTARWPAYCIDWEFAARELRMDYTAVDFDGVTYWIR